jgi:hypothetical protein
MAVRQNPDWMLLAGDLFHWVSRPPRIYYAIIFALAAALYLVYQPLHSRTAYVAPPRAISPQQTYQPQVAAPQNFPQRLSTQNNCPPDYIFINSLSQCTPIINHHWYIFKRGNLVHLSKRFATRVTTGHANVISHGQRYVVAPIPRNFPPYAFDGGTVIALDELDRIGFEFLPSNAPLNLPR